MGLSDASWFAATVAILLGIYIGERILDIDFSVFLAKSRKKGKIKRMMEQRGDTTLQKSGIRRDIRKAFERILIPLEKADKNRLPSRMDMTFRKNIVRQIDRLNQQKLCREILMTDVETQPDNDFERWNNDGREWRESIIKCSALERLISTEDGKTVMRIIENMPIFGSFSLGISETQIVSRRKKVIIPPYRKSSVHPVERRWN